MNVFWESAEHICPVCGKRFYVMGQEWGWSYYGSRYCSYHCMRHVEVRFGTRTGEKHKPLDLAGKKVLCEMRLLRSLSRMLLEWDAVSPLVDEAKEKEVAKLRSMQVGLVEKFEKLLVGIKEEYRWIWKAVCVEGVPLRSVARALDISGDLLVWKIEEICAQVAKKKMQVEEGMHG
ncbi:MAG: hypothetical protein IJX70_04605 [Clostridia bacterium]|nr:hypothetical protein [Clostridia bacterium]